MKTALILVASLFLLLAGCTKNPSGFYVEVNEKGHTLDLRSDGTGVKKYASDHYNSFERLKWTQSGSELTLVVELRNDNGKIRDLLNERYPARVEGGDIILLSHRFRLQK